MNVHIITKKFNLRHKT